MSSTTISVDAWSRRAEVRRIEDDELLGFVVPTEGGEVATTMFGTRLVSRVEGADPRLSIEEAGLSYLADTWVLERDIGPLSVQIVEASPEEVVVQNVDYGSDLELGVRFTVRAPVDRRLRPR